MGFVQSHNEIKRTARGKGGLYEFYDAEMLVVMWETKPEIIKRLLPPPLKPTKSHKLKFQKLARLSFQRLKC